MRVLYFLIFLIISNSSFGQNKNEILLKEKVRIDSIIENINSNQDKYFEGISEGILTTSDPTEKGGWELYYLYKDENLIKPTRIIYNEALEKTYKNFEFFYNDGKLIFANLKIEFYEESRNKKPILKKFYFENSKLIYETNKEIRNYDMDYMKRTEKFALNMIQD